MGARHSRLPHSKRKEETMAKQLRKYKRYWGYRKMVLLTARLQEWLWAHPATGVAGYLAHHEISNPEDVEDICKVARLLGRPVHKRAGVWYEASTKLTN